MRRGLRTLWAAACIASVAACSGDADSAESPSATLGSGPTTERTTTTLSVEQEVEAAYLRSWEVYADAVLTFDTSQLEDVYVGDALRLRIDEVARLRDANTPARMVVEHNVSVFMAGEDTAVVHDDYVNHSVLLNAETGEPIEEDPDELVKREYHLRLVDETWKVSFVAER